MVSSDSSKNTALSELLEEIRETQVDFAGVRTELSHLHENVKSLSRLVRDGNGGVSIITQIALLKQKIDDIYQWRETHYETHYRIKKEINTLREDLEKIERTFLTIEKEVKNISNKITEQERITWSDLSKKAELAHEQNISDTKIKEERQKMWIKIIAAIIVAILTFVVGYFVKNMDISTLPPTFLGFFS